MKRLTSLLALSATLLTLPIVTGQELEPNYFLDSNGEKRHYITEAGQFGELIHVSGNFRLSSLAQEGTEQETDPAIEIMVDRNKDGAIDEFMFCRLGREERHPVEEIQESYRVTFTSPYYWYNSDIRVNYLENVDIRRNVPPFHPEGTEIWHTDEQGNLIDRAMWMCGYSDMPGEHYMEPLYCVKRELNYTVKPEYELFSVEGESQGRAYEQIDPWFSLDE
jgi:hypothetical protein